MSREMQNYQPDEAGLKLGRPGMQHAPERLATQEKIRKGDDELLGKFLEENQPFLAEMVERFIENHDLRGEPGWEKEDVLQEINLNLIEELRKGEKIDLPKYSKRPGKIIDELVFEVLQRMEQRTKTAMRSAQTESLDAPQKKQVPEELQEESSERRIINEVFLKEAVKGAMQDLPERLKTILRKRFVGEQFYSQIGENLGVSGTRVIQLENKTLKKMRSRAKEYMGDVSRSEMRRMIE